MKGVHAVSRDESSIRVSSSRRPVASPGTGRVIDRVSVDSNCAGSVLGHVMGTMAVAEAASSVESNRPVAWARRTRDRRGKRPDHARTDIIPHSPDDAANLRVFTTIKG